MEISQTQFRAALSRFATGVTVVTARDQTGLPIGMTASSFNSVSMDPPLVLWSVTKSAFSAVAFKSADFFAIHVLAVNQTEISNKFATAGADKFVNTDFKTDSNNVPVIPSVACRFDCKSWSVYDGGDHWIIVGQVLGVEKSNLQALLFADGEYAVSASMTG